MDNLSKDLALPCTFLHSEFNHKQYFSPHAVVDRNITVHNNAISFFADHGIQIWAVEIFYRRPAEQYGLVHIDNEGYTDRLNLNYVIGGVDSVMTWFKTTVPDAGYLTKGDTGASPRRYHLHEVEPIHSAEIKQPSLIQSAVPHAILNKLTQRWCICANLRDIKTNDAVTWDLAMDRLKNYII